MPTIKFVGRKQIFNSQMLIIHLIRSGFVGNFLLRTRWQLTGREVFDRGFTQPTEGYEVARRRDVGSRYFARRFVDDRRNLGSTRREVYMLDFALVRGSSGGRPFCRGLHPGGVTAHCRVFTSRIEVQESIREKKGRAQTQGPNMATQDSANSRMFSQLAGIEDVAKSRKDARGDSNKILRPDRPPRSDAKHAKTRSHVVI